MKWKKTEFRIAPRQATFKSQAGSYIAGVIALLTQFGRREITLEALIITAVLMITPILASYFGIPTGTDSSVRLAATLIESIRGSSMSAGEQRKLEMIIILAVGQWDKINQVLKDAHNGHGHPEEPEPLTE